MKLSDLPTSELARALAATLRILGADAMETKVLARELARRERPAPRTGRPVEVRCGQ